MSELAKKGSGGSGAKSASGTITTNGTQTSITVSGIGFQPTGVEVLCVTQKIYSFNQYSGDEIVYLYNNNNVEKHQIHTYDSNSLQVVNLGGTLTPNSDGFTLTGFANLRFVEATFNWRAWKE